MGFCEVFGQCLGSVWVVFGECLGDVWGVFGGILGSVWRLFGRCLGGVCQRLESATNIKKKQTKKRNVTNFVGGF